MAPTAQTIVPAASVTPAEAQALRDATRRLPQDSPVALILTNLLAAAANGEDFIGMPASQDCTPNQVARMIGASRPHVYSLMDRGVLVFHTVGKDRRVHLRDVLDYIERRERASAELARDLASQQADLNAARDKAAPVTDEMRAYVDAL